MIQCPICFRPGVCADHVVLLVSDAELKNSDFILDGRAFCYSRGLTPELWPDFTMDCYRDMDKKVYSIEGHEVSLNPALLEHPYTRREWWRDFCCKPCPDGVRPHVRREAIPRVRMLLTILRGRFSREALLWGLRPVNDTVAKKLPLDAP